MTYSPSTMMVPDLGALYVSVWCTTCEHALREGDISLSWAPTNINQGENVWNSTTTKTRCVFDA